MTKRGLVFIEQNYTKYLFGQLKTCHVFLLSLLLANMRTIRRIYTVHICSVHHLLVLNPTVNILELGRISTLMRATTHFHFLITFHCTFQRHKQQQRT